MARKQSSYSEPEPEIAAEAEQAAAETVETTPEAETVVESVAAEPAAETIAESVEAPQTALERTAAPETITDAIREGACDARSAVDSLRGMVRQGVYNGFYYLTYGVVFGGLVVGSLIPSNNAMGEGVKAGFKAARDDFETQKTAAAEAAPADEGLVAA
jgi:hypothetical protein